MIHQPGRILQIAHNHPDFHPGGTELVALALHRHWRQNGFDSWFLGAADPTQRPGNPGTNMIAITPDQRESVIFFDGFTRFKLEQPDLFGALREFQNYLEVIRPDIVHFHHILSFGLEAIHLVRSVLPKARIILTLHDYYLICANNGQLFKYHLNERCNGPSIDECRKCLPNRSEADFRMRALDIANTIGLVDRLVSPSRFLADKFAASIADCPPVEVIENSYLGPQASFVPSGGGSGPVRFGYFGNVSRIKGVGDLLEAAENLLDLGIGDFTLEVHGSQLFEDKALDEQIAKAREVLGARLRFLGKYGPGELPARMAKVDCVVFPSLWWENAPLVIYEALHYRKPLIAYPHGGAVEILDRYKVGKLADQSSPAALAEAMASYVGDRDRLPVLGPVPLPTISAVAEAYRDLYANGI